MTERGACFDRFESLVPAADERGPLEELVLLAGGYVPGIPVTDPAAWVQSWRIALDDLAGTCTEPTFEGIGRHLFVDSGFVGNTADYYDPLNSYLHEVLDRRLGIPITLSIVALAVGDRLAVPVHGVGLPGHFLVGDTNDPDRFLDPFGGGAVLDRPAVEALFRDLHGPDAVLGTELLAPTRASAIVSRVLANLKHIHSARGDRQAVVRVMELRVLLPDVHPTERRDLARALTSVGRFPEAADELDALAALESAAGHDEDAETSRAAAVHARARLNWAAGPEVVSIANTAER